MKENEKYLSELKSQISLLSKTMKEIDNSEIDPSVFVSGATIESIKFQPIENIRKQINETMDEIIRIEKDIQGS